MAKEIITHSSTPGRVAVYKYRWMWCWHCSECGLGTYAFTSHADVMASAWNHVTNSQHANTLDELACRMSY